MGMKGGAGLNVCVESHVDFPLGFSHALRPHPIAGKCLSAGPVLTLEIPSDAICICIALCMLVCCAAFRCKGRRNNLGHEVVRAPVACLCK